MSHRPPGRGIDSASDFELLSTGQASKSPYATSNHLPGSSVDTLPLWEQYQSSRAAGLPEGAHGLERQYSPSLPPFYSSNHGSVGDILDTPSASVGRFAEYSPLDSPGSAKYGGYFGEKGSSASGPNRLSNGKSGLAQSNSSRKKQPWSKRKKSILLFALLAFIIIAAAIVGGVTASRKMNKGNATPASSTGAKIVAGDGLTWGGNGSNVTTDDGSTFIYNSSFGGIWVSTPFNNSAQVRSDVPALDQQWDWSTDLINGVNLGGWFVIEPFITPAMFEAYADSAYPLLDEWDLSIQWGSNLSAAMEDHYNTFITERDFAQIASTGLNWVRLPIPYWFIETWPGEPFLEGVGWKYFLKAISWARKYGIRIELDVHALPGSQNGQNHSGKVGLTGWLNGTMGLVNAQRSLNYLRSLAEFAAQPQYSPVIQSFMMGNEINVYGIGVEQVQAFYLEAYNVIRAATGIGAGNGPMLIIHDGFQPASTWAGFMSGSDRIAKEIHQYLAYSPDYFVKGSYSQTITRPCEWWAATYNTSMNQFGFTFMGEWALANNDCGQYIQGVGKGSYYDNTWTGPAPAKPYGFFGECAPFLDYENYSAEFKTQMSQAMQAYWDTSRNWIFWSWKMGTNSTGLVPNPQWSYQLGLENGWIPNDPRPQSYLGACQALAAELGTGGPTEVEWSPPLDSWMTGGAGANTITNTSAFAQWPVTAFASIPDLANLPTMTATVAPSTLSALTPTGTAAVNIDIGNGWFNPSDTSSAYASVTGCTYPNAYSADAEIPDAPCTGAPAQRRRHPVRSMPTVIS